jgi:hypothetical protein
MDIRPIFSSAMIAAAVVAGATSAAAQSEARVARSGQETRVGASWNCNNPAMIPNIVVIEAPKNGTVTQRQVAGGAPCNGLPALVLFYTSRPGFKGVDTVSYRLDFAGRGGGSQRFERRIEVR